MVDLRKNLLEQLRGVKLVAMDFDGVLTDGFVMTDQHGNESVRCSRRDSLGIEMVKALGIPVVVISKEKNPVVLKRCEKMGVTCFHGAETGEDKLKILTSYLAGKNISLDDVLYVGDDVNDLPVLEKVGYPMTVADAHRKVQDVAGFVTKRNGGDHAVREICDLIINSRR